MSDIVFDPSQPFDVVEDNHPSAGTGFDPTKPFSVRNDSPAQTEERQKMARDLEKLQAEKVSDQFSGFEKFIARAGAGVQKAGINAGRMLTAANDVLFLPEITGLFSQRAGDAYRQAVDRDLAYWNKREEDTTRAIQQIDDNSVLGQIVEGTTRAVTELPAQVLPGMAARTTVGAVKAAAATGGGFQGLSTYGQERGEGRSRMEALPYAVTSGLITALTTKAFGATGVESVFKKDGVQGIGAKLLNVLKEAGMEGAEEAVDQFQQDLLERAQRNPEKPIGDSIKDVLMAGTIGSLVGGLASGAHTALTAESKPSEFQKALEEGFSSAKNRTGGKRYADAIAFLNQTPRTLGEAADEAQARQENESLVNLIMEGRANENPPSTETQNQVEAPSPIPAVESKPAVEPPKEQAQAGTPLRTRKSSLGKSIAQRILFARGVDPDVARVVEAFVGPKRPEETAEDYRVRLNAAHDEMGFKVKNEVVGGIDEEEKRRVLMQQGETPEGIEQALQGDRARRQEIDAANAAIIRSRVSVSAPAPTMEFARRVSGMSPQEFVQNAQSFNRINLELGRNVSDEELAELEQLRGAANQRVADAMKKAEASGDPKDAEDYLTLSTLPQFFNEAIAEAKAKRAPKQTPAPPVAPVVAQQPPEAPPQPAPVFPQAPPQPVAPVAPAKPTAIVSSGKPNGSQVEVEYQVVEANEIRPMIVREVGADQTRQRVGNVASNEQIAQIAANPDINLLSDSPTSTVGAPIVDDAVIAGNGRLSGIIAGYDGGTRGSINYRRALIEKAKQLGLGDISGMVMPVLIRRVKRYVNGDKRAFVVESNPQSAALKESVSESAILDSEALGDLSSIEFNESGSLSAAGVTEVARRFAAAQRNLTRTTGGTFDTAEANKRVQLAALAKIAKAENIPVGDFIGLLESEDGKRVISEVTKASPRMSALDQDLQIGGDIIQALRELHSGINAVGSKAFKSLDEWNAERKNQLIKSELGVVGDAILKLMIGSQSSGSVLREFFNEYIRQAEYEQTQRKEAGASADIFGEQRQPVTAEKIAGRILGVPEAGAKDSPVGGAKPNPEVRPEVAAAERARKYNEAWKKWQDAVEAATTTEALDAALEGAGQDPERSTETYSDIQARVAEKKRKLASDAANAEEAARISAIEKLPPAERKAAYEAEIQKIYNGNLQRADSTGEAERWTNEDDRVKELRAKIAAIQPAAESPKAEATKEWSVGSKVQVKNEGPTLWTIVAETTDPKFPDERIFKIQNDKTGKASEYDMASLKPAKARTAEERESTKEKTKEELQNELLKLNPALRNSIKEFKTKAQLRDQIKREKAKRGPVADLGAGLPDGTGWTVDGVIAAVENEDLAGFNLNVITKDQAAEVTGRDEARGYGGFFYNGQVYLVADNIRAGNTESAKQILREEVAHGLLRTEEGLALLRQALNEGKLRLTKSERDALLAKGYKNEGNQLLDEFIAKSARENTKWWQDIVLAIKAFLSRAGLKLSNEDAARILLKQIKRRRPDVNGNIPGERFVAGNAEITAPDAIASPAITAFHGTPHKVKKFSTSRIGTGEGARVYGWGLYFAESESVANHYEKSIGKRHAKTDGGNVYTVRISAESDELLDYDKTIFNQSERVQKALKPLIDEYIAELKEQRVLYKRSTDSELRSANYRDLYAGNFYIWLGDKLNREQKPYTGEPQDKKASIALYRLGVKGIRYLDQDSRSRGQEYYVAKWSSDGSSADVFTRFGNKFAGNFSTFSAADEWIARQAPEPTYNYVIFSGDDIAITHENGNRVSVEDAIGQGVGDLQVSAIPASGSDSLSAEEINRINRELNALSEKTDKTAKDHARIAELEAKLGQLDLFAAPVVERAGVNQQQREDVARPPQGRRLLAGAIEDQGLLFAPRGEEKQGDMFTAPPAPKTETPPKRIETGRAQPMDLFGDLAPSGADNPEFIRAQVGGVRGVGQVREVENIAEIRAAIKERVFNATPAVTDERTEDAWRIANELTDEVTKAGHALRYRNEIGGQEMGLPLLQNELFRYGFKLASSGDETFLRFMLDSSADFQTITGGGRTTSGRVQRAARELADSVAFHWLREAMDTERRNAAISGARILPQETFLGLVRDMENLQLNPDELEAFLNRAQGPNGNSFARIVADAIGQGGAPQQPGAPRQPRGRGQQSPALPGFEDIVDSEAGREAARMLDRYQRSQTEWLNNAERRQSIVRIIVNEALGENRLARYGREDFINRLTERLREAEVPPAIARELAHEVWADKAAREATETARAQAGDENFEQRRAESILNRLQQDQTEWVGTRRQSEAARLIREFLREEASGVSAEARIERLSADLVRAGVRESTARELAFQAGERKAAVQASARIQAQSMTNDQAQSTADGILRRLQDRHSGVEWLRQDENVNQVREIVRQALQGRLGYAEGDTRVDPILQDPTPIVEKIQQALEAVGVDAETARNLGREIETERQNRWANQRVRQMERASRSNSVRSLIEDILNTPYRAQHDPVWRRRMAVRWFESNGLSNEQAEAAADLFNGAFEAAYRRAAERVAERVLRDGAPNTNEQFERLIRSGVLDPSQPWLDKFAEQSGWVKPTADQFAKIAELEEKLVDPELSPSEVADIIEQQRTILRHVGKKDGAGLRAMAEHFTASLLSQAVTVGRTFWVQFAPVFSLLKDFGTAVAFDPKNSLNFAKALVSAYENQGKNQLRYGWQRDAFQFHINDITGNHNELKRVYETTQKLIESPGTSKARKAAARVQQIYALGRFVFKLMNTIDNTQMSIGREWKIVYYASRAFKDAGVESSQKISQLIDAMNAVRQSEFDRAIDAGLDVKTAAVRADHRATQAALDFVSGEAGGGYAMKVLQAAENDMYNVVGRLAPDVGLNDEGLISRYTLNPIMEFASNLRKQGGIGNIVATVTVGMVNIPFRAARAASDFYGYGLIRYGIHKYRTNRGMETFWKQSFSNELQAKHRRNVAIAGLTLTVLGALAALKNSTSDDDANDKDKSGIFVTGSGPKSKNLRDEWIKKGWSPYTLHVVVNGSKIKIPLSRVGEPLFPPFLVGGVIDNVKWAQKDAKAKGKEINLVSTSVANLVAAQAQMLGARGFFQSVNQYGNLTEGGGAIEKNLARMLGGTAAALLIPFKSSLSQISEMILGPMDNSSASAIVANQFPIIGIPWQKPAVNRFGDAVFNQTLSGKLERLGVPVTIQIPSSSQNERLYNTLINKGIAPPELRRYVLEEKFGDLTDDQFSDFARKSGALLKQSAVSNLNDIQRMSPTEAKRFLQNAAERADKTAAAALGLERREKPQAATTTSPAASVPAPAASAASSASASTGGGGSSRASASGRIRKSLASFKVPRLKKVGGRIRSRISRGFKRIKAKTGRIRGRI